MSEQFPYDFGKYRIEAEIGRGGFGNVYRAVDTALERPVALKLLDPIYMRDRTWIGRFRREAIVMAKLDHPNIVPIYDTGEQDGQLFLAMKLVNGSNLADVIAERRRLPWDEALGMMRQIASALDYAHGMEILHRDIKPANILLEGDRVLLTDFGLARILSNNSMTMTTHGGITGTYQYMAPELFDEGEAGKAADIYALGCILYELVTGAVLFAGETTAKIIGAHLRPLQLSDTFEQDVPDGLRDILHIALAKDPADRYNSGAELMRALDNIDIDTLAEPYANLEQAIAQEDWESALQLADAIHTQNPNYRDVQALHTRAQTGQDAEQRQEWADKWRIEAEAALAEDDVVAAEIALERWRETSQYSIELTEFVKRLDKARQSHRLKSQSNKQYSLKVKALEENTQYQIPKRNDEISTTPVAPTSPDLNGRQTFTSASHSSENAKRSNEKIAIWKRFRVLLTLVLIAVNVLLVTSWKTARQPSNANEAAEMVVNRLIPIDEDSLFLKLLSSSELEQVGGGAYSAVDHIFFTEDRADFPAPEFAKALLESDRAVSRYGCMTELHYYHENYDECEAEFKVDSLGNFKEYHHNRNRYVNNVMIDPIAVIAIVTLEGSQYQVTLTLSYFTPDSESRLILERTTIVAQGQ